MSKFSKSEKKILLALKEHHGRYYVEGKRMVSAARKLAEAGWITFETDCRYVTPRESKVRNKAGDWVGYWYHGGSCYVPKKFVKYLFSE